MNAAVLALANSGSYTVVTTHLAGKVEVAFGDPAGLLSLDPQALEQLGYQGHLVGETPVPCAWNEPCASSIYLVRGIGGSCCWLESRSVQAPSGELVVNTRLAMPAHMLSQTARLSMAGGYLGPIAHELNNIVQGVSSAVYLFRDSLEHQEPIDTEDLDQLGETAGDLTTLAAELQGFARVGLSDAERLDFGIVLTKAIRLLRAVGRLKTLDFELQLPEQLPAMHWRRYELDLVLLALLSNAADAALEHGSPPTLGVSVTAMGDSIQIEIIDNGAGFEMQDQGLFKSTKAKHRHPGLGLASVRAIVANRGGRLDSLEHAGGTHLRLILPLDS